MPSPLYRGQCSLSIRDSCPLPLCARVPIRLAPVPIRLAPPLSVLGCAAFILTSVLPGLPAAHQRVQHGDAAPAHQGADGLLRPRLALRGACSVLLFPSASAFRWLRCGCPRPTVLLRACFPVCWLVRRGLLRWQYLNRARSMHRCRSWARISTAARSCSPRCVPLSLLAPIPPMWSCLSLHLPSH